MFVFYSVKPAVSMLQITHCLLLLSVLEMPTQGSLQQKAEFAAVTCF